MCLARDAPSYLLLRGIPAHYTAAQCLITVQKHYRGSLSTQVHDSTSHHTCARCCAARSDSHHSAPNTFQMAVRVGLRVEMEDQSTRKRRLFLPAESKQLFADRAARQPPGSCVFLISRHRGAFKVARSTSLSLRQFLMYGNPAGGLPWKSE